MTNTDTNARRSPWQEGVAAAKANLLPGLLLQAVALSIVAGYYFHEPTHAVLQQIQQFRVELGIWFSICSTAIFAGLVPFALQKLQKSGRRKSTWNEIPFLLIFWGIKGLEVDLFYRFQAWKFGDAPTFIDILPKVIVDQLIYVPIWAIPSTVIAYAWKDEGYSWSKTRGLLGPHWIRNRLFPILVSNWAVWIPAVAIIYCLPLPLQLPLQNLVLCMWVLILMFLTSTEQPSADILLDEIEGK